MAKLIPTPFEGPPWWTSMTSEVIAIATAPPDSGPP